MSDVEVLFNRNPTTLASPTSWGLQRNLEFTFKDLHSELSWPPYRNTPDTHLASTSLSCGGGFYNPFPASLTLKPEPEAAVLLHAGAGTWPLVQLHLHQLCLQWFPALLAFHSSRVGGAGLALKYPLFH